jgi:ketosteroid isomerase-like protein
MDRTSRRTLEDWVAVLAPPLYRVVAAVAWWSLMRLEPPSRLRRRLLLRTCRRFYGAFNRRDLPVFVNLFDPEVVYDVSHIHGWPERQVYRGRAGVAEMARDWFATWDFFFELVGFHDLGGPTCLVLGDFHVMGSGSGVPLEVAHWAQVATGRRGRGVRIDTYSDRREALRVAGLGA